ncbi:MAG: tRNA (adenosine(37)-N6)-threonylcarbamoyltransferase complex ATPase subunit type 1 TsaE [Patescibacteria group bacterium]
MEFISRSEKETARFAACLAATLRGGDILALSGDLGAGKTTFVKGLAAALGVKRVVTSPTFTIMKEYETNCQKNGINHLVHIDAYRLESEADVQSTGLTEMWERPDIVTAIEWPEKIRGLLPGRTRWLRFETTDEAHRKITAP